MLQTQVNKIAVLLDLHEERSRPCLGRSPLSRSPGTAWSGLRSKVVGHQNLQFHFVDLGPCVFLTLQLPSSLNRLSISYHVFLCWASGKAGEHQMFSGSAAAIEFSTAELAARPETEPPPRLGCSDRPPRPEPEPTHSLNQAATRRQSAFAALGWPWAPVPGR